LPEGAEPFIIPPGGVPDGMVPEGEAPESAVPFAIPAGGVPEGAVPVVRSARTRVPDGVPAAACWFSVTVGAAVAEDDGVVELCVQPATRIPAMRSADPISMSIVLFFIGCITWITGVS